MCTQKLSTNKSFLLPFIEILRGSETQKIWLSFRNKDNFPSNIFSIFQIVINFDINGDISPMSTDTLA